MTYRLADVEEAERRIREAVPTAIFDRLDHNWRLSVSLPGLPMAWIVFQPRRDNVGREEIIADVGKIIEHLKAHASGLP